MNPVTLFLASGESLYWGAGILLATVGASPWVRNPWLLRLRNLAAWTGLAMMVLASPPFAYWLDGVFLLAFGLWFVMWNRNAAKRQGLRKGSAILLAILLLVLPAMEWPHRKIPAVDRLRNDHLVVIGDSISASIDANMPAWPELLRQAMGIDVKSFARPGAQVSDAVDMAAKVLPEDRLVLVEIGGNDFLANVPAEEFGRELDTLLHKLASPGRIVLMFELPLLPHKVEYGRIQRRLAAKYGVVLIPKRCFISVLSGADATSDGLHLSPAGARRMVKLVAGILSNEQRGD